MNDLKRVLNDKSTCTACKGYKEYIYWKNLSCDSLQWDSCGEALEDINKVNAEPEEMLGYYIGLNFFRITSLVLFFIAYRHQRKAKRALLEEQINEIGKQA